MRFPLNDAASPPARPAGEGTTAAAVAASTVSGTRASVPRRLTGVALDPTSSGSAPPPPGPPVRRGRAPAGVASRSAARRRRPIRRRPFPRPRPWPGRERPAGGHRRRRLRCRPGPSRPPPARGGHRDRQCVVRVVEGADDVDHAGRGHRPTGAGFVEEREALIQPGAGRRVGVGPVPLGPDAVEIAVVQPEDRVEGRGLEPAHPAASADDHVDVAVRVQLQLAGAVGLEGNRGHRPAEAPHGSGAEAGQQPGLRARHRQPGAPVHLGIAGARPQRVGSRPRQRQLTERPWQGPGLGVLVVPVGQRPLLRAARRHHRRPHDPLEEEQVGPMPGQEVPTTVLAAVPRRAQRRGVGAVDGGLIGPASRIGGQSLPHPGDSPGVPLQGVRPDRRESNGPSSQRSWRPPPSLRRRSKPLTFAPRGPAHLGNAGRPL